MNAARPNHATTGGVVERLGKKFHRYSKNHLSEVIKMTRKNILMGRNVYPFSGILKKTKKRYITD
jgi:hypothetical protein